MEGFLLLYETFISLFFVSFKNFDFRNEIMLRTPSVCVWQVSSRWVLLISFLIIFVVDGLSTINWKYLTVILFLLLLFLSIYFISHVDFPFLFLETVLFFGALVLLCDYFSVWLQGNLRKVNVERVQCLSNMGWNISSRLSYWVPLETIKFVFLSYIFPRNWTSDKILGFMLLYGLFSEHIRTAQAS